MTYENEFGNGLDNELSNGVGNEFGGNPANGSENVSENKAENNNENTPENKSENGVNFENTNANESANTSANESANTSESANASAEAPVDMNVGSDSAASDSDRGARPLNVHYGIGGFFGGYGAQPLGGFDEGEAQHPIEKSFAQSSESASTPDYSSAQGEKTYIGNGATADRPYGNGNYGGAGNQGFGGSGHSVGQNGYYGNGSYGNPNGGYGAYGNEGGSRVQPQNGNGQRAGIRYDADKTAGDGSYTWNYSQSGGVETEKKNSRGSEKRRSGHNAFIAVMMVFAVIATAVVSSIVTSKFVRNDIVPSAEGEVESGKPVIGQNGSGGSTENMVTIPSPSGGAALTKQQIAEKCKPSSVGIQTTVTTQSYFGYSYKSGGVGSGFILTSDGYIATNHHVIENADSITVQLDDGTKYEAVLVGSDAVTDLAVIKIEATDLVPMEIGDSDKMVVGDSVIAIGTPAGIEFAGTVTDGIISAINRGVEITNERGSVVKTMTLMQTNAAINPGNSGGPLINDKGEVIGINTLKLTSTYEGIGFSIPINSAVTVFNQLITDGKVSDYDSSFVTGNGAIGITNYVEIGEEEAKYYNVPVGIVILSLDIDSSAYKAGLKRYDTIIAFEGQTVKTVAELNKLKASYKAGDEITLTVSRDGVGEMDITFKLDLMS